MAKVNYKDLQIPEKHVIITFFRKSLEQLNLQNNFKITDSEESLKIEESTSLNNADKGDAAVRRMVRLKTFLELLKEKGIIDYQEKKEMQLPNNVSFFKAQSFPMRQFFSITKFTEVTEKGRDHLQTQLEQIRKELIGGQQSVPKYK